jgi:hypothetical protein
MAGEANPELSEPKLPNLFQLLNKKIRFHPINPFIGLAGQTIGFFFINEDPA